MINYAELEIVEEEKHLVPNLENLTSALFGKSAFFLNWQRSQKDWATNELKRADGMVWLPWKGQLWLIEVEWKEGSNFFHQSRAFARSEINVDKLVSYLKGILKRYEKVLHSAAPDMKEGTLINNIIDYTIRNHYRKEIGDDKKYFYPNIWVILGHGRNNFKKLKYSYLKEIKDRFKSKQNYILSMSRIFQSAFANYILLEQDCSDNCSTLIDVKKSILVPGISNANFSQQSQIDVAEEPLGSRFVIDDKINISSDIDKNGRGGELWNYLRKTYDLKNPKNVKLRIQLDSNVYYDFAIDWEHSAKELMVLSKNNIQKKPSNAAKEVFGKKYPPGTGNIGRKFGRFVDTSNAETKIIAKYYDIERAMREIKNSKPEFKLPSIDNDTGARTYFDDITTRKQKQLISNVLNRKNLWIFFIKNKKMTTEDFKRYSEFKSKAIAGFMHFLKHSGLATRSGNVFHINETAIPHLEEFLRG